MRKTVSLLTTTAATVATVALCLLLSMKLMAATATGSVYLDVNADGKRDAGESGVPDVRISDGIRVTKTDVDGAWSLNVDAEAVIFLVKPSGHRTAFDDNNLPLFYYIHQPKGSPKGLRYVGVEPTGPLPDSIDFGLTKQLEANQFDAILLADTQPQTDAELDYIRDNVVTELIGSNAKFGMTMGDILFDDLSMFPRLIGLIGQVGVPWYNVPGNHELNLKAADDQYSLETFKRYFGPSYYSFEYADALFVVLDNIEYQGNGQSDPGDVRGNGGYIANLGKRQLNWLKQELSYVDEDKLVFLAMHSPLETYVADSPGVTTKDRTSLFKLLKDRPNLYSVAGHTHTTEHHYFGKEDGFNGPNDFHHHILSTVSGSWWSGPFDEAGVPMAWQSDGSPNGYHVLTVDGAKATVRFKAAGEAEDYQMRIMYDVQHQAIRPDGMRDFRHGELFDGRMTVDQVPAASILVNLFDGGPKSKVSFQVDDGPTQTMTRVKRTDPMLVELYTRHKDSKKSWVNAVPSSHLFEADLPDDLASGVYTISVHAVDEFGTSHHAHSILEITGR